jgi:hypothetical protein
MRKTNKYTNIEFKIQILNSIQIQPTDMMVSFDVPIEDSIQLLSKHF